MKKRRRKIRSVASYRRAALKAWRTKRRMRVTRTADLLPELKFQ